MLLVYLRWTSEIWNVKQCPQSFVLATVSKTQEWTRGHSKAKTTLTPTHGQWPAAVGSCFRLAIICTLASTAASQCWQVSIALRSLNKTKFISSQTWRSAHSGQVIFTSWLTPSLGALPDILENTGLLILPVSIVADSLLAEVQAWPGIHPDPAQWCCSDTKCILWTVSPNSRCHWQRPNQTVQLSTSEIPGKHTPFRY